MTFQAEMQLAKRSAYKALLQKRIDLGNELSTIDDLLSDYERDLGISTDPSNQPLEKNDEGVR